MDESVSAALAEILGHTAVLRPGQKEAIEAALQRDTLAVLATATGKSLIYRVVGRLLSGATVVVSPTLALQADQLAALTAAGPAAVLLNSLQSAAQRHAALHAIECGDAEFVLLAPEQLVLPKIRAALTARGVSLFVVDEAHCVSSWGHDFRPAYLQLAGVIAGLGRPRVLALTATASPRVRQDVVSALNMHDPAIVVGEVDRPEIHLSAELAVDEPGVMASVARVVLATGGSATGGSATGGSATGATIVYCATRGRAEAMTELLTERGLQPSIYHGGMSRTLRNQLHRAFRDRTARLIVATNAFGLGVDRPDVRLVVHADPPASLDDYWQEAGRAGRDGAPAAAVLVTHPHAYGIRRYFAAGGVPSAPTLRAVWTASGTHPTPFDDVARTAQLTPARARRAVNALLATGALAEDGRGLRQAREGADTDMAGEAVALELQRREQTETAVELVRRYAETTTCRRRSILQLLGEADTEPCGNCDNCDAGHGGEVTGSRFAIGERVRHPEWGVGVVEQNEQDRLTVLFAGVGHRTLSLAAVERHNLLSVLS